MVGGSTKNLKRLIIYGFLYHNSTKVEAVGSVSGVRRRMQPSWALGDPQITVSGPDSGRQYPVVPGLFWTLGCMKEGGNPQPCLSAAVRVWAGDEHYVPRPVAGQGHPPCAEGLSDHSISAAAEKEKAEEVAELKLATPLGKQQDSACPHHKGPSWAGWVLLSLGHTDLRPWLLSRRKAPPSPERRKEGKGTFCSLWQPSLFPLH